MTAGNDLTGGGTSGSVTLNLDTTKVPQLAANNNFVGNQSVTGNLNLASGAFQPVTLNSSNGFGTWLALGNSRPARACTAVVIKPSGAPGISTIAAANTTIAV